MLNCLTAAIRNRAAAGKRPKTVFLLIFVTFSLNSFNLFNFIMRLQAALYFYWHITFRQYSTLVYFEASVFRSGFIN